MHSLLIHDFTEKKNTRVLFISYKLVRYFLHMYFLYPAETYVICVNIFYVVRNDISAIEIDTKCLETEFTYLEYLQPLRSKPTHCMTLVHPKTEPKHKNGRQNL